MEITSYMGGITVVALILIYTFTSGGTNADKENINTPQPAQHNPEQGEENSYLNNMLICSHDKSSRFRRHHQKRLDYLSITDKIQKGYIFVRLISTMLFERLTSTIEILRGGTYFFN